MRCDESTIAIVDRYATTSFTSHRIACQWLPSALHQFGRVGGAIVDATNIDEVPSLNLQGVRAITVLLVGRLLDVGCSLSQVWYTVDACQTLLLGVDSDCYRSGPRLQSFTLKVVLKCSNRIFQHTQTLLKHFPFYPWVYTRLSFALQNSQPYRLMSLTISNLVPSRHTSSALFHHSTLLIAILFISDLKV